MIFMESCLHQNWFLELVFLNLTRQGAFRNFLKFIDCYSSFGKEYQIGISSFGKNYIYMGYPLEEEKVPKLKLILYELRNYGSSYTHLEWSTVPVATHVKEVNNSE